VKKIGNLLLGVVTSVGGFVEVGSISTSAQAGSQFGVSLLWSIAAAGVILAMLIEMSGRLAALGHQTVAAATRERFGIHYHLVPLVAELVIDVLLIAAELGGAAIAMRLLTGVGFVWWIAPIAAIVWLLLWLGSFSLIENGLGLLGLVTLSFVVAVWQLHPSARVLARGLVPSLPDHDLARYGFLTVSIVGATVSPYLLNFYASGAVEEKWTAGDVWLNRATAFLGMGFGTIVSMGVLVTAALVLGPQHIEVDSYEQAALMFVPVFGRWGVVLFAASLWIGCLGAAVEISLNGGYLLAQGFGWSWGANRKRRDAARFSTAFTGVLVLALAIAAVGIDPLRLTLMSVALTVVIMPLVVLPFLVLMNDDRLVKGHTSSALGNGVLAAVIVLGAVFALVVIPLEIMGR
jgi:Mn2+/Fe2+ NRAMP family transporter